MRHALLCPTVLLLTITTACAGDSRTRAQQTFVVHVAPMVEVAAAKAEEVEGRFELLPRNAFAKASLPAADVAKAAGIDALDVKSNIRLLLQLQSFSAEATSDESSQTTYWSAETGPMKTTTVKLPDAVSIDSGFVILSIVPLD